MGGGKRIVNHALRLLNTSAHIPSAEASPMTKPGDCEAESKFSVREGQRIF